MVSEFDWEKGPDDLEAALAVLRGLPEIDGRVGVLGFCFGGTFAYLRIEIHVQEDGGHAFHNRKAPMFYQPGPADRAWQLTEEFLSRTLPPGLQTLCGAAGCKASRGSSLRDEIPSFGYAL